MPLTPQTPPHSPAPADVKIKLRPAAWRELRKLTDTESDHALANRLGMNRTTVYRVTTGDAEVSAKFVAHTLAAFRFASFHGLFDWAES